MSILSFLIGSQLSLKCLRYSYNTKNHKLLFKILSLKLIPKIHLTTCFYKLKSLVFSFDTILKRTFCNFS